MIPRPDLLDADSPAGLEVFQLTHEPQTPSSHIYMEAQVFWPDSARLLLHRSAHAHGSDPRDPEHQFMVCDLQHGGLLSPFTDEVGATAIAVAPDGRSVYYFVDETEVGGGRLSLMRRPGTGGPAETVCMIDSALPGTRHRPSRIYPLSTISSDGRRIALPAFLGDGRTEGAPWGLLVFDIPSGSVQLVLQGPSWCNMHPQYSRSLDADASHNLLVQENHGNVCRVDGTAEALTSGLGCDIHVIRDDGTNLRDLPWGRDGVEQCQGHQCWRGRSDWAITATLTDGIGEELIESRAVPHSGHRDARLDGEIRNRLSQGVEVPNFFHFATDISGRSFITDTGPWNTNGRLFQAELGRPGEEPFKRLEYLMTPRSSWRKDAHMHPFLSPDGRTAFFNSDESGVLQAYMLTGLPISP